jgi:hypothetical protein
MNNQLIGPRASPKAITMTSPFGNWTIRGQPQHLGELLHKRSQTMP